MRPALRRTLYALASLALLLLAAVVFAPWFLGQERLRQLAENLAEEHAGLELQIAEPVQWRILPRPSLVIEGASMHLTHGATAAGAHVPLLQVERLTVALAVLPLLSGEVEAARLELSRPVLHLLRNSEGRWNWQNIPTDHPPQEAASQKNRNAAASPFGPLRRASLVIEKGRVFIQDMMADASLDLRELDCSAGLEVDDRPDGPEASLDLRSLSAAVSGPALPWGGQAPLHLEAGLRYAPELGRLTLDSLQASLNGIALETDLTLTDLTAAPQLEGRLVLEAPVSALAPGAELPGNPGPLRFETLLAGDLQRLVFEEMSLSLESNEAPELLRLQGAGSLELQSHGPPRLELRLQGPQLDTTPLAALAAAFGGSEEPQAPPPPPAELLAWTRALHADIALDLERLQTPGLELQDVALRLNAGHGGLRLTGAPDAALAHLGQGALTASLRASLAPATGTSPEAGLTLEADASLEGADAVALLQGYLPQPMLEGAVAAELSLAAAGARWPELGGSLTGELLLQVREGGLPGLEDTAPARRFRLLEGRFDIQGQEEAEPLPEDSPAAPELPENSTDISENYRVRP